MAGGQVGLDLGAHLGRRAAGVEAQAHVDPAVGGHAAGPFTAADLAQVEVDRVRVAGITGMACGRAVPGGFQLLQPFHHLLGIADGRHAGVRHRRMHRQAVHVDGEPHHAHLRAHHAFERLGDDGGVGGVALDQAGQRAVAGAFLFDHALQVDRRGGLVAQLLQRAEGLGVGHDAGLHVGGAAAVHAAGQRVALDARGERRAGPEAVGAHRHHVDVAVEDQAAAAHRPGGLVDAHHVAPAGIRQDRWRVAGVVLDLGLVDLEFMHPQAQCRKFACHQHLGAGFVAQQRRLGHQVGQQGHRLGLQGGHGIQDLLLGERVQGLRVHGVSSGGWGRRRWA